MRYLIWTCIVILIIAILWPDKRRSDEARAYQLGVQDAGRGVHQPPDWIYQEYGIYDNRVLQAYNDGWDEVRGDKNYE